MNREIKFRAWDLDTKTMNFCIFVGIGKIFNMTKTFKPKEEIKNAILMQYTGLKDKNDKEIYEGDIVIFRNGNYEVIYNYDRFELKNFNEYVFEDNQKLLINYDLQNCIVIGNIYENSKLLQEIEEVSNKFNELWKPKYGEKYFFIDNNGLVEDTYWYDFEGNIADYNNGNCFKTREQAKQRAKKYI